MQACAHYARSNSNSIACSCVYLCVYVFVRARWSWPFRHNEDQKLNAGRGYNLQHALAKDLMATCIHT